MAGLFVFRPKIIVGKLLYKSGPFRYDPHPEL